jgi:penicillin amidase
MMRRKVLRSIRFACAALLVVVLAGAATGWLLLRGSLARVDGRCALVGLTAPVAVERDDLGVPRLLAASRDDAMRALGYLHAQDRFFQMDLMRRAAAGELAELLGPALRRTDRDVRRHRFRSRLEAEYMRLDPPSRALLDAYTAGVNAGLDDLRARPFEYLALRQQPSPWRPVDSLLVVAAMYLDLGMSTADTDLAAGRVREALPPGLAAFLLPEAGAWDAPLQDGSPPPPPVPPREQWPDVVAGAAPVDVAVASVAGALDDTDFFVPSHDRAGSNNWAVAGRLTRHGGALLADDMHLGLALPNTWYRAEIRVAGAAGDTTRLVGVTLPGAPGLIVGSNGHVAWGFTNAYADWLDLVVLEVDPADSTRYRTPDGWDTLRTRVEVISVARAAPETLRVRESRWGPVWTHDAQGRPLALRWAAHDTGAINLKLVELAAARTVDDVVALAPRLGMPGQNVVCADRDGRVAWTIASRLPRRTGWNGRWPVSFADGICRWDGWVDAASQPRVVDPPEGLLWTANNRVAAGADLQLAGDGGYGLGARAAQIRDDLRALSRPDEKDLLGVQLDDRAVMMGQWREVELAALGRVPAPADAVVAERRAQFARLVRESWDGHASTGSIGYRLARGATGALLDIVYADLTAPCRAAAPGFDARELPLRHAVVWALLEARPAHLLPAPHGDWDQVVAAAVDTAMARMVATGKPEAQWTWGERNRAAITHPLVFAVPQLKRWLATPATSLPGDANLPRVQSPTSGASERLVVSPGREQDGIFHMPGGQSGHPLSPYFLAGHEDWEQGRATPLLPGATRHRLRLEPRGR